MALAPPAAPAPDPQPLPYGPLFVLAPARRQRPRGSIVRFGRVFHPSVLRSTGAMAPRGVPAIVVPPGDGEEGGDVRQTGCTNSDKFLLDGMAKLADTSLNLCKSPMRPRLCIRVRRKVKVASLSNRHFLPLPGLPGAAGNLGLAPQGFGVADEDPPLHPHD